MKIKHLSLCNDQVIFYFFGSFGLGIRINPAVPAIEIVFGFIEIIIFLDDLIKEE